MMKKGLVLLLTMAVVACSTLTPAEKEEQARKVNAALDERSYEIEIQMVYPFRGPAKNVTSDWSIRVRNDTLYSYLPYIGRAYNVPYGGGKGLNFDAPIEEYVDGHWQKDQRRIDFRVVNEEDTYLYSIEVYENGNATINVQARERDRIAFSGILK